MAASTSSGPETIGLNRSERMYLGIEGVAGSLTQVYAIRFAAPVEASTVREALRAVVRAHPRLRAVVEPTVFGHRLRVHPVGRTVDVLFDAAFRAERSETDDDALADRMGEMLSEAFAVERDLPIKAKFLEHPSRPALLLSVHHIAGDGRTLMGWIRSLHRVLNGEELETCPLDPPSHLPALVPPSLAGVPRALFDEARAIATTNPFTKHLTAPIQPISGFGPVAIHPRRLTPPASALVAAARARKTTIGTLMFSATALAFHRLVRERDVDNVRARLSIDLRDLYPAGRAPGDGNYVSSFLVDVDPRAGLDAMLPQIDARMKSSIERFQKRSMMLTSLAREASSWLGRHQTGRAAIFAKRTGRHRTQSFHLSNLGRVDGFEGGRVPFDCVLPSLSHPDLLVALLGFRGHLQAIITYPRSEMDADFVRALAAEMDDIVVDLVAQDSSEARARARVAN